jgi:DNA-binding NtrC family response regulator
LRNVVERLVLLSGEEPVGAADVRLILPVSGDTSIASRGDSESAADSLGTGTLAERTEQFEREVLLAEIHRQNFHMTNVARSMGLERSHLYKKCQQLGIDLASMRKVD